MKPCQLFLGSDRGKQQAELARVLERIRKDYKEEPEILHRYGGQDSAQLIVEELKTGSLFNDHLVMVVFRSEEFPASELKHIQAYWSKPSSSSRVIFVAENYTEGKKAFKFAARDEIVTFFEPDEREKVSWIKGYIQKNSGSIDSDALLLFAELVESDTLEMQKECDVLLALHSDKKITSADVDKYIFHSREETVYTLFETLLDLNLEHSLSALQKILLSQQTDPVGLVTGLQWQFRNLQTLHHRVGRGPASKDAFYALFIRHPHSQIVFNRALLRWSEEDIAVRLAVLADYDIQLRMARPGTHRLICELLVYQMVKHPRAQLVSEGRKTLFAD